MEHIEQCGIHSGDSGCSLPPYTLSADVQDRIREQVRKLAMERSQSMARVARDVIDMARAWLPAVHRGAFDDPRLTLHLGDGRAFIESCESQFDQIVLDLTDPFGPAVALYTCEFYRACRRAPARWRAVAARAVPDSSWRHHGAPAGVAAKRVPGGDRKSTRLNSSHMPVSRMPSSA